MRLAGREFTLIGENIHTTRVVLLKGKRVCALPGGGQALRFTDTQGRPGLLPIPEKIKGTQDYQEGRVKHLKIALQAAMAGAEEGVEYLRYMVRGQEQAGADFLVLAAEAGADSGIVDPVSSPLARIADLDRSTRPYQLTEEMLLGRDVNCKNFLRAYRKGELEV
ncbi:MAG: hypothetical protein EXS58_12625 [Candidatus Latescibacteria bacterium]|nr:hypothetical protein [Candidatus Latescibacterota bacterium]